MDMKLTRRQFIKGAAIAGVGMALPLKFWKGMPMHFTRAPACRNASSLCAVSVPARSPLSAWTIRGTGNGSGPRHNRHPAVYRQRSTRLSARRRCGDSSREPSVWRRSPPSTSAASSSSERGAAPADHLPEQPYPPRTSSPWIPRIPGANQAQNRTAIHLHGGLIPWISDGGPFDWWAPNGTHGLSFLNNEVLNPGGSRE